MPRNRSGSWPATSAGYPAERITVFTDTDNAPAQSVLESTGFRQEGTLLQLKEIGTMSKTKAWTVLGKD